MPQVAAWAWLLEAAWVGLQVAEDQLEEAWIRQPVVRCVDAVLVEVVACGEAGEALLTCPVLAGQAIAVVETSAKLDSPYVSLQAR